MLQGAPAPKTLWWKEVTGRRITIGHLYTIYMQDKLIHDRQPLAAGLQEGLRQGRGPGASANLQQGPELNWGLPLCATLCCGSHEGVIAQVCSLL